MSNHIRRVLPLLAGALLVVGFSPAAGQTKKLAIERPENLILHNSTAAATTYRGRPAIKVTRAPDAPQSGGDNTLAAVKDTLFTDGTIEVDLASTLSAEAKGTEARGFIGVAFRVPADRARYEYIYLRPTNGRAEDQVRRNHSTQYAAHPDFPWMRLRKESPEKYESYVDLELGVWTAVKIVVKGTSAQLFVNGAPQPCLIVNDLKLGVSEGAVALQIGPGTEGYFSNLRVTSAGGAAATKPSAP